MKYILRDFQASSVDKAVEYIRGTSVRKPLIIAPTGAGKSLMIADLAARLEGSIIVLQPSKELLKQNHAKYLSYGNDAAIYSASLGSKEIGHVTFATIGSIKKEHAYFKIHKPEVILVDEAHLQSKHGSALAEFIKKIGVTKVIGYTATPIELRQGLEGSYLQMINRSRKNMFNDIIHVTQISHMVDKNFWSPIEYVQRKVNNGELRLNTSGSDYTLESIKSHYTNNDLNVKIEDEVRILLNEEKRRNVLVFVPSILEAEVLKQKIVGAETVHSKLPTKERDRIIKGFLKGEIKVVINVNVLAVGFDFPELDSIILARATKSFAIYYQQAGRGVRIHPGKENIKIVDLVGNIERFGKLENIEFREKKGLWGMYVNTRKLTAGLEHAPPLPSSSSLFWFGKYNGIPTQEISRIYLETFCQEFEAKTPEGKILLNKISKYLDNNKN